MFKTSDLQKLHLHECKLFIKLLSIQWSFLRWKEISCAREWLLWQLWWNAFWVRSTSPAVAKTWALFWISAANNANTASCILKPKIHAAVIYSLGGSCKSTLTPYTWAEFYIWVKSKLNKFFPDSSSGFILCCQMWTHPQPASFKTSARRPGIPV